MNLPPKILAEHPDFWVVFKPAGLSFHRDGEAPGLVEQVRDLSGQIQLHPVHRLDRITSGLILLARHPEAAAGLGALFAEGEVEKYYLALSDRPPGKKQGMVKGGMVKARGGSWRLTRDEGLPAVTQFFSYGLVGPQCPSGLRLFVVRPRTGRTHQIRVALKSLGSPILGDSRYGGTPADRGYLHAWAIRFNWQGESLCYHQPPEHGDFFLLPPCKSQIERLHPAWSLPWP